MFVNCTLLFIFITIILGLPFTDVTIYLLQRYPNLATLSDSKGSIILNVLSKLPSDFQSGNKLGFWKRCIYHCKDPILILFSFLTKLHCNTLLPE